MNEQRWMARSLSLLWLWSGLQPLLTAQAVSLDMLAQLGIAPGWQWPLLCLASLLDIVFGVLILCRPTRGLWLLQLAVVAVYSLIIAIGLPQLWLHPFAPLLKNLPIMAMLLYLADKAADRRLI